MYVKFLILLSAVAIAAADDFIIDESTRKFIDECLQENNLTEEKVHEFAQQQDPTTATTEIKNFLYCFSQKTGTFDGIKWNMDRIKTVVKDEKKMKEVEECLKRDDKTSEPRERNFAVVTCCMEKEAFM